jgi:hypothetical protein
MFELSRADYRSRIAASPISRNALIEFRAYVGSAAPDRKALRIAPGQGGRATVIRAASRRLPAPEGRAAARRCIRTLPRVARPFDSFNIYKFNFF